LGRFYFKHGVKPKREAKTENVESKITFSAEKIRKIIKIVATICQILRLKCTKIPQTS